MSLPSVTFQVFAPEGSWICELPNVLSFDITAAINDHGSFKFSYLKTGVNYAQIAPGRDFELEFSMLPAGTVADPTVSHYNCRFISMTCDHDPNDPEGVVNYSMVSYSWLLRRTIVGSEWPIAGDGCEWSGEDGTIRYRVGSANQMLSGLINDRPARRTVDRSLQLVSLSGTYPVVDMSFAWGSTVDAVMQSMVDGAMVEWSSKGRQIVCAPVVMGSGLALDLGSGTTPGHDIRIVPGREIVESTITHDMSDYVTYALGVGDALPVTFKVTNQPDHGDLSGDGPAMSYSPDNDWVGTDHFTYTSSNGHSTTNPIVVDLVVTTAKKNKPINVNLIPADVYRVFTTAENPPGSWGQLESSASASGDDAQYLGNVTRGTLHAPGLSYTYSIDLNEVTYAPFSSYTVGAYIMAPNSTFQGYEPLRIVEMAVSMSNDGAFRCDLVMNTRRLEYQIKVGRRIAAFTGGVPNIIKWRR